jgi:hypothetical protein
LNGPAVRFIFAAIQPLKIGHLTKSKVASRVKEMKRLNNPRSMAKSASAKSAST